MKTDAETRQEGMRALVRSLGMVEAERFIASIGKDRFDYTAWRRIKRRASLFNTDRIDHLYQTPHVEHQRFTLHYGDLTDSTNLIRIVQQVQRFTTGAAPLRWPSGMPTGSRSRQNVSATAGDCAAMASAMLQPDLPLERDQLAATGQFSS